MYYLKHNGKYLEINGENVVTFCGGCGKEMFVDLSECLAQVDDLYGMTWFCEECGKDISRYRWDREDDTPDPEEREEVQTVSPILEIPHDRLAHAPEDYRDGYEYVLTMSHVDDDIDEDPIRIVIDGLTTEDWPVLLPMILRSSTPPRCSLERKAIAKENREHEERGTV